MVGDRTGTVPTAHRQPLTACPAPAHLASPTPPPTPQIDFITDFNAAISGGTQQWALNLKQIAWAVFATTQGMLIFASINIVRLPVSLSR